MLDYPGKICAIVFTNGCNFRCPYCHNYEFVENIEDNELFSTDEVMEYLIKRKNVLDGLTISGGEPTIQSGLEDFIKEVKEKTNLLIKLDTNGTNPDKLKKLIDDNLIDYVAMDIKSDLTTYSKVTGLATFGDTYQKHLEDKMLESINIIKENLNTYEFRTTVIKNYHNKQTIENILKLINDDSHYYMQKFIVSSNVPHKELSSYEDDEFKELYNNLKKEHPQIKIRGVK